MVYPVIPAFTVPYLAFILFTFYLFFIESENKIIGKSNRGIQLFTLGIFLIFIGLRGHINSDWVAYYPVFSDLPYVWDSQLFDYLKNGEMESGFLFYSVIIKSLFSNYFVWVFINTIIDLLILDKLFRKYTDYYVLAFITFFIMNGLAIEFNLYRNSKALVLFLLSLEYLKDKKMIPYLLINLLGVTFHYSALLFLPLYFILNKEIPRFVIWSIFIVSNAIFIFRIKWISLVLGDIVSLINIASISDKMNTYSEAVEAGFTIGYFERIFSFVIFSIFYKDLIAQNPINRIFYNSYVLFFVCMFTLSEIGVFSSRFSYLFIFSYWFLYPNIYSCIKSKRNKYVFIVPFLCFVLLRTYKANTNLLAKYDNLLWGIENYDERYKRFEEDSRYFE
jgi:hypothetical protein